jgi:hypothetical protein
MVGLQLRIYYFFESSASEMRKEGLLRAYNTALNLIAVVADEDPKTDFIKYMPNIYCLMLHTAGLLIMKIINSSYARYVDIDRGRRSFHIVLRLVRNATLEDNDVPGRGGKIMAQLSTVHQSQASHQEQEPRLSVKSRLGASVIHDGLWTWRDQFGGQGGPPPGPSQPVSNPTPSTPSTSPAASNQFQQPTSSKSRWNSGTDLSKLIIQITQIPAVVIWMSLFNSGWIRQTCQIKTAWQKISRI